jgi:hypothetical protein
MFHYICLENPNNTFQDFLLSFYLGKKIHNNLSYITFLIYIFIIIQFYFYYLLLFLMIIMLMINKKLFKKKDLQV